MQLKHLGSTGKMNRRAVEYKLVDSVDDIARSYEPRRRPKRSRILLHEWQSMVLEYSFRVNAYPDRAEKYNLFVRTRVPMKNIKIWFQNRRAREKSSYEEAKQEHAPSEAGCKAFDSVGERLEELESYGYQEYAEDGRRMAARRE